MKSIFTSRQFIFPCIATIGVGIFYIVALHSGSNEVNGLLLNRAVEMSRLDEWLQGN